MKHRIVGILSAALMLLSMSAPALAAAPPSPSIYPAEVRASEENGVALGVAGYFGRKWYKHYINKKRGYE